MKLDLAAKYFALFTGSVQSDVNVQSHQLFPAGVAEHAQECVIAIQKLPFGRGNENSFLHLLKQ